MNGPPPARHAPGLRPGDDLTRKAAAIDASRPHDPLPVPPTEDELARLATTLNSMLDRIEKAMHERKKGTLKSGGSGKKVTNPKQAIAIGLSEARKEGGKVPPAKKSAE